jgi:hypothetical protein
MEFGSEIPPKRFFFFFFFFGLHHVYRKFVFYIIMCIEIVYLEINC